ncbi:Thioredoxin [Handroanthus impetiginosus]|uniref:Thioredoxin n=1 Tax=Handroanthus impetiginosus TaxID=429701 RepID=A0A2G9HUU7_9LAMI|nr:Thioredoxin [Handroanthus impetiginosus]
MGQCWTKSSKQSTINDTAPDLAGGNVHLVTTMDKWEKETSEANMDGKVVVVNFSASWCNPCRQIAPAYRELADKYSSILFLTVDVDELAEFSTTWDVKATPTFFFLRDGRQLDKLVGAKKEELHKKIMDIAESNTRSQN